MRALAFSILALFAYATAVRATPDILTWNFDKERHIEFTCNVLQLSDEMCESIEYPEVVIASYPNPWIQGVRGFYMYNDIIYITPYGLDMDPEATLIHELVHYIDTQYRGYPKGNRRDVSCQTEENAHLVGFAWKNARPNDAVDPDDYLWRNWYGCEWRPVHFGDEPYAR